MSLMIRKSTQQQLLLVQRWTNKNIIGTSFAGTPVAPTAVAAPTGTTSSAALAAAVIVKIPSRSFFQSITGTNTSTTTAATSTTIMDKKSLSTSKNTPITKNDIAKEIAENHDLTIAKSERIVNTVFDTIVESLSEKNTSVKIAKFGLFESYESAARLGRNPSTGESMNIPSKTRIRFKPYSLFKESVNK